MEINKFNYEKNKELYRKRQEINEHIFGTIKRQWGYNHTNLKGLKKVNGEMALIMTVYNMKRVVNIVGIEKLLEKLKTWKPKYPKPSKTNQKRTILRLYSESDFYTQKLAA